MDHLNALELGLHHERQRLAAAKSDSERELRTVWVAQKEREIAGERALLGLPMSAETPDLTDDEVLAELGL